MSTLVHVDRLEGQPVARRIMRVRMTFELFQTALTDTGKWSDHLRVQHGMGLPVGARLVHVETDMITNELIFVFEHESFELTTLKPQTLAVNIESYRCGHKPPDSEK